MKVVPAGPGKQCLGVAAAAAAAVLPMPGRRMQRAQMAAQAAGAAQSVGVASFKSTATILAAMGWYPCLCPWNVSCACGLGMVGTPGWDDGTSPGTKDSASGNGTWPRWCRWSGDGAGCELCGALQASSAVPDCHAAACSRQHPPAAWPPRSCCCEAHGRAGAGTCRVSSAWDRGPAVSTWCLLRSPQLAYRSLA